MRPENRQIKTQVILTNHFKKTKTKMWGYGYGGFGGYGGYGGYYWME